ncbi:MAG: hypothetical protein KGL61_09445 [Burkholderiales bacterium]|nr:hypothetical protein [Burkholderiales bacterium]
MSECREGHYPYPDENVFLITGVRVDNGPVNFDKTVPMVVVSRRRERAMSYYVNMFGSQKWEVSGIVSLEQLRGLKSKMTSTQMDRGSLKEIKAGVFGKMFGKRQAWAIAIADSDNKPLEPEIVVASSSTDVIAYVKSPGKKAVGVFSMEMLDELIDKLEDVKFGRAKEIEYATDIKGGELAQELAEVRASMTDEEKEEADAMVKEMRSLQASGVIR